MKNTVITIILGLVLLNCTILPASSKNNNFELITSCTRTRLKPDIEQKDPILDIFFRNNTNENMTIPHFVSTKSHHLRLSTKNNMHLLQTMLEIYAVDWGGYYPDSISELEKELKKGIFWKELKNHRNADLPALEDMSIYLKNQKKHPGQVVYNPSQKNEHGQISVYKIYATDAEGQFIGRDSPFILTNA